MKKGYPHRASKKVFLRSLVIGVIVSLITFFLSSLGILDSWENGVFDFLSWWEKEKRSTEIFIIEIDDSDYRDLFHSTSPLSRETLSKIIFNISLSQPKAIGLDISMEETGDEKPRLFEAFQHLNEKNIPVILPLTSRENNLDKDDSGRSISQRFPNILFGIVDYPISKNGVIRDLRLFWKTEEGEKFPSFALSLFAAAHGLSQENLLALLNAEAGNHADPTKGQQKINTFLRNTQRSPLSRIHYIGDKKSYSSLKSSILFTMLAEYLRPPNIFSGKIVLLGGTFKESRDFFQTPKGQLSGLEIIANSINTLMTSKPIKSMNHVFELLYELGVVFLLSYFFFRFSPFKALVIGFLSIVPLSLLGSVAAFTTASRWLNFIPAAFSVFVHGQFSLMEGFSESKAEIQRMKIQLAEKEKKIEELKVRLKSRQEAEKPKKGV